MQKLILLLCFQLFPNHPTWPSYTVSGSLQEEQGEINAIRNVTLKVALNRAVRAFTQALQRLYLSAYRVFYNLATKAAESKTPITPPTLTTLSLACPMYMTASRMMFPEKEPWQRSPELI
ncbi:hypothetical protein TSMEX_005612 [Taenia solium]|eukprot:TsM_001019000 transcript=TsM_001019000 gene=TsM_001019000